MKTIPSITGAVMLMFILTFNLLSINCFSQDELAMASSYKLQAASDFPKAELRQAMADTVMPTICNHGQGLLHYECSFWKGTTKDCRQYKKNSQSSTVMLQNYSESEINTLFETERFMERQSVSDIQEQIRKDKMDLNLGDAIKGFYSK